MAERRKMLSENLLLKNEIELMGKDEIFEQIPRWDKYFISNYGRLLHKNKKGKYTIVNPSITKGGYLSYTVSKPARTYRGKKIRDTNGKPKNIRDCRTAQYFVATVYVKNPYPVIEYSVEDLQIHHKDRDRQNNYYKNLMWLCKSKNGRKDHDFIHSIKKFSLYNEETTNFHTYHDIDILLKRIDTDVLEFIDSIRYNEKLFKSQDGKWDLYEVNGYFVGIQFFRK